VAILLEFEPFDEGMFNELQEAQLALDSLLVQVTGFRRECPRMLLAMMQEKQEKEGQAITEAKEKRKAIAGEALDTPSMSLSFLFFSFFSFSFSFLFGISQLLVDESRFDSFGKIIS